MKKLLCIIFATALLCAALFATGCNKQTEAKAAIYDISATLTDNKMELVETVYYTNNTGGNLSELKYHLYANAFREGAEYPAIANSYLSTCYYDGKSYGGIVINGVKVNNETAEFILEKDNGILNVSLSKELKPYEECSVELNATVTIPECNARFGITENSINLGNFYPILCVYENGYVEEPYYSIGDPFYSEVSDYYVTLTTATKGILASTGVIISEIANESTGTRTFEIEAEKVRDFAAVMVFEGERISQTVGDTQINYVYFDDSESEISLTTAVLALNTFNDAFGDYPYKSLNVVQTDFVYGGMEYPNLVYISSSLLANSKNYTIVHEIAHQWWYGLVGSNSVVNPWQDEGLAEFSTALFYKLNNNDYAYNSLIGSASSQYVTFSKMTDVSLGNMQLNLSQYPSNTAYTITTYDRGMLMFNNIYEIMGERAFLRAMKDYASTYSYLNATPDDLMKCLDKQRKGTSVVAGKWLNDEIIFNY